MKVTKMIKVKNLRVKLQYQSFVVVFQLPRWVWLSATPWTAACQTPCPSPSTRVCPSSCSLHWWCRPAILSSDTLFSFCPWSFPASGTFPVSHQSSVLIRWPKYWSFSFSISPSSEYSGFISLKIDWFDLLALQGTFRSLLRHHSLKVSILWHSAFFMVQLSQQYVITGKTTDRLDSTDLCQQSNVSPFQHTKFFIAFLPRSNHLLISWLQSPSTVILELKKIKSVTTSTFPPSICYEVMGLNDMILFFFF